MQVILDLLPKFNLFKTSKVAWGGDLYIFLCNCFYPIPTAKILGPFQTGILIGFACRFYRWTWSEGPCIPTPCGYKQICVCFTRLSPGSNQTCKKKKTDCVLFNFGRSYQRQTTHTAEWGLSVSAPHKLSKHGSVIGLALLQSEVDQRTTESLCCTFFHWKTFWDHDNSLLTSCRLHYSWMVTKARSHNSGRASPKTLRLHVAPGQASGAL